MTQTVRWDVRDHIATIRLVRPDRGNALDEATVESLLDALQSALALPTACIVIRSEGANFCTGFDLSSLHSASDGDLLRRFIRIELLLQRVFHAPVPVVALAQGRAIGAGADLFCACSYRYATSNASFRFPGFRFGIALGTRRLSERLGFKATQQVLLEDRSLNSVEAQSLGLVDAILAEDDWSAALARHARVAERLGPSTVRCVLALTTADTRNEDLAALIDTASPPGLKDRLSRYIASDHHNRRGSGIGSLD